MITELRVQNWKSFGTGHLYIDPLTVLIGTNSSGKSNLLEALVFLSLTAKGVAFEAAFNNRSSYGTLRGTPEMLLNKSTSDDTFCLEVTFFDEKKKVEYLYQLDCSVSDASEITLEREELNVKYDKESDDRQLLFTTGRRRDETMTIRFPGKVENRKNTVSDISRQHSALSRLPGNDLTNETLEGIAYVTSALNNIMLIDPMPQRMRAYSSVGGPIISDCSNVAGVLAKLSEKDALSIQTILTNYIDLLSEKDITKVWAQKVPPLNKDAMLYIEESWPGREPLTVDAESASDGTLHLIGVMVAILIAQPGALVIIEEIDKGLHPSRAELLSKFLKEMAQTRGLDIICTTHNPALLDAFGNEMIGFMSIVRRNEQDGQSEVTLVEDIKHLGRLLAKGKIGRLSTLGLLENKTLKSA